MLPKFVEDTKERVDMVQCEKQINVLYQVHSDCSLDYIFWSLPVLLRACVHDHCGRHYGSSWTLLP